MKKIGILLIILSIITGCKKESVNQTTIDTTTTTTTIVEVKDNSNIKVTFIELGSVNCVPCRMMQPVMKKIEEKYGNQVKVVFYDVWTQKDAQKAYEYGIRVIPTQVFLDSSGKEYLRHEGYFPFEELEKILRIKGVK